MRPANTSLSLFLQVLGSAVIDGIPCQSLAFLVFPNA
jgi:hypothetical protein